MSFRFKRFAVAQGGSAMKVGTDGVLLGAWCGVERWMERALDIGTGTGLVALMIAQRGEDFGLRVDGVEIDEQSCRQAVENIEASEWSGRMRVINSSVQEFVAGCEGAKYDLVVSNPPYFSGSLLSPDSARSVARHTTELTQRELMNGVGEVLSEEGLFAVVLPYEQATGVIELAAERGLWLSRRTDVYPNEGSLPKRVLMEFSRRKVSEPTLSNLTIELSRHSYTREYIDLTREFYLKF